MSTVDGQSRSAGPPPAATAVSWRSLGIRAAGSLAAMALLGWVLSGQSANGIAEKIAQADFWLLSATVPLVLVNMALRSGRWRSLLGSSSEVPLGTVFSAQMIGYLANNVLPVRLGDLVRVYVLGNMLSQTLSRSRILSTVLLERILDMGMVVFLLGLITAVSPLPGWMRTGAGLVAVAAFGGIALVTVFGIWGDRITRLAIERVPRLPQSVSFRLVTWSSEFAVGVQRFRQPPVFAAFFGGTLVIWLTEILLVVAVGRAFSLPLGALDAAVLMLFSLFSSFIPALPAQIGTFEFAMVSGLAFVGRNDAAGLPFAVTLHLVLLAGTTVLGAICLLLSGLPLMPREFIQRVRQVS